MEIQETASARKLAVALPTIPAKTPKNDPNAAMIAVFTKMIPDSSVIKPLRA